MKVAIYSDPVYLILKDHLFDRLTEEAHQVDDLTGASDRDMLGMVRSLIAGTHTHGILLSDNAHTAAMLANRFPGIRAVVCADVFAARTATTLSNANLLIMSETQPSRAWDIVRIWLAGAFQSRNGHTTLLNLIDDMDRLLEESERSSALLTHLSLLATL